MTRRIAAIAGLIIAFVAWGQPTTLTLVGPSAPVAPGTAAAVEIVLLHRTSTAPSTPVPPEFAGVLLVEGRSYPVRLRRVSADEPTPTPGAGTFTSMEYRVELPAGIPPGPAILETQLAGFAAARAVVEVGDVGGKAKRDSMESPLRPTTNLVRAQPAAAALRRTFVNRISPHEPIYFISGTDAPAAKFQFSFKYKLLDFADVAPQRMARTLQFGFTQRSLWDIGGVSSPFYDTSYMPELMYESLAPQPEASDDWFTWLGFQGGYKHESNGRAGPLSRSVNTVYVRPVLAFGNLEGWHLLVIPELSAFVGDLADNPDVDNYRGYGRLSMILGRNDGPSLLATAWAGKDFSRGSVQLDLTFPIRTRRLHFETYLLFQYFNGYGESLLWYSEHSSALRAGISLVR